MSRKRKKRKNRSRSRDAHRFEGFLDHDHDRDHELEPEVAYDDVWLHRSEPALPRVSRRFDFERWRDDLVARDLHRQRMRRRELKRGALSGFDVPYRPADDDDFFELDDDF